MKVPLFLRLLIIIAGTALVITGVMVFDELYNLALYCRTGPNLGIDFCTYPYPWTGPLGPWLAWEWAFGFIIAGWLLSSFGIWLETKEEAV